jgi:hypothetical protein
VSSAVQSDSQIVIHLCATTSKASNVSRPVYVHLSIDRFVLRRICLAHQHCRASITASEWLWDDKKIRIVLLQEPLDNLENWLRLFGNFPDISAIVLPILAEIWEPVSSMDIMLTRKYGLSKMSMVSCNRADIVFLSRDTASVYPVMIPMSRKAFPDMHKLCPEFFFLASRQLDHVSASSGG